VGLHPRSALSPYLFDLVMDEVTIGVGRKTDDRRPNQKDQDRKGRLTYGVANFIDRIQIDKFGHYFLVIE
jgi:hypothetical protein